MLGLMRMMIMSVCVVVAVMMAVMLAVSGWLLLLLPRHQHAVVVVQ
jgi:hypothetical protein